MVNRLASVSSDLDKDGERAYGESRRQEPARESFTGGAHTVGKSRAELSKSIEGLNLPGQRDRRISEGPRRGEDRVGEGVEVVVNDPEVK